MSRKQWSKESMAAALQNVREGMNVREAARLYNLPFETLRRRVVEKVPLECRSGPPTVLTEADENELALYCVKMADMGFGLARSDVMAVAFKIAETSGRKHPFTEGTAGRAWFDGFRSRHPKLTLRSTQSLSHARASSANQEIIGDYFGKLAAVCAKLNLLTKPMQIYNMDETGVTVVHKPGKVVTEVGRRNVWAVTSGEKGKTHTILSCVSAAGSALPPFMIFPRKRITDNLKSGAVPGTTFHCSDTGWVNTELFFEWLQFFVRSIPPSRPVLLILDGHSSHISIEAVEFARSNGVHMLCIPAHTTHILQPLDVGVFKSFKAAYNKACKKLLSEHPHRVITTEQIAGLIGKAWPQSLTPVNIMSGFKKCGIYPLNPGEVTDRQIAPSTVFVASNDALPVAKPGSIIERDSLYRKRYNEGYDIYDDDYLQWIRENKLELPTKASSSEVNSTCTSSSQPKESSLPVEASSVHSTHCGGSTASSLSEILVIPKPNGAPKKKRQAVNSKASCITDSPVLQELKRKKEEKEAKEEEKKAKKLEREKKKKEREKKKKEQEDKKKEREKKKEQDKNKKEQEKKKERTREKETAISEEEKTST